jgi:hypothetical protein
MEEREKNAEERLKDLENLDVAEVDDENLEDASGGGNMNCGCGPSLGDS